MIRLNKCTHWFLGRSFAVRTIANKRKQSQIRRTDVYVQFIANVSSHNLYLHHRLSTSVNGPNILLDGRVQSEAVRSRLYRQPLHASARSARQRIRFKRASDRFYGLWTFLENPVGLVNNKEQWLSLVGGPHFQSFRNNHPNSQKIFCIRTWSSLRNIAEHWSWDRWQETPSSGCSN